MTMAVGVNSKPYDPSGPARDSVRYTASPTTTGGNPMKALSTTMSRLRPANCHSATAAPIGRPIKVAIATADKEIFKDSTTMLISTGSIRAINSKAVQGEVSYILLCSWRSGYDVILFLRLQ